MWRFAAAAARGTSHVTTNLPCQDRLECRVVRGRTLVAVVADGAGSAALAELGADIAVKAVVEFLSCQLDTCPGRSDYAPMLRAAAGRARLKVLSEAQRLGESPRELASTLLVALVGPEDGSVLQIGDGVVVVSDGGRGWGWVLGSWRDGYAYQSPAQSRNKTQFRWVFWPRHGEYANTTNFLTDTDALDRLRIAPRLGRISDVALMTDGLESLALQQANNSVHGPFFRGMFEPIHEVQEGGLNEDGEIRHLSVGLEHFLSSDRVRSRTDDDMSLILASRKH